MLPFHSTRFLAASERVGGLRTKKRRQPGREVVVLLTWTWHRAVHVRAYRSWAPHASTMRIRSHSTHFPVSCTCIRSCGSLRFTFHESRAFSRTRRCRDLRFNGSSIWSKLWKRSMRMVELGLSGCLSLKSGFRQMSRLPWLGLSDRGKTLWTRL
jgi:hypothetical protein